MGEVVLGIQRSQKSPHPQAQKFDDIERLILESKLSGDEEVRQIPQRQPIHILTLCRTCMHAAYMLNRPREQRDGGSLAGCVLNPAKEPQERNLDVPLLSPTLPLPFLMPPRPYMIDKHYPCTLPALRYELGSPRGTDIR